MKKLLVLIVLLTVTFSASAHQDNKRFDIASTITTHNEVCYTSVYTESNGGLIQLIYNMFTKVGEMMYTSTHDETPTATQKDILIQE